MLTELQCRSAKPKARLYKLADSSGLFLAVLPSGHRSWRMKYRFDGKEQLLVFGPYPEISLKEARELRDDARKLLRSGEDPRARRREEAAAAAAELETVERVARRWHDQQKSRWKSKHAQLVLESLEKDVFPVRSVARIWAGKFGDLPIGAVRPGFVRELLKRIQERGAIETAHRVHGRLTAVFKLAIAEELVEDNPAEAMSAVLKPVRKGRMPALTKLEEARAFLRAAEATPAEPGTKLASRLLAITAVRPGIIRWTPREGEFTGLGQKDPYWTVPAVRMKLDLERSEQETFDLVVPLPWQAVEVIRVAQQLAGNSAWLFPGSWDARKPISENALSYFYGRVKGFAGRHVPHGWRSTFSSVMNELAADRGREGDADVIELMLAHKAKGVRGIYNRAAYMKRRREIAQEWADMLLEGFPPAESLLQGDRR